MGSSQSPSGSDTAQGFRVTELGRKRLVVEGMVPGTLTPHQHDLLKMCTTGASKDQLRQFMPPRSLDSSLQSLLVDGLLERCTVAHWPPMALAA